MLHVGTHSVITRGMVEEGFGEIVPTTGLIVEETKEISIIIGLELRATGVGNDIKRATSGVETIAIGTDEIVIEITIRTYEDPVESIVEEVTIAMQGRP